MQDRPRLPLNAGALPPIPIARRAWPRALLSTALVALLLGPIACSMLAFVTIYALGLQGIVFRSDPEPILPFPALVAATAIWGAVGAILFGLPVTAYLASKLETDIRPYLAAGTVIGFGIGLLASWSGLFAVLFAAYGATYAGLFWLTAERLLSKLKS